MGAVEGAVEALINGAESVTAKGDGLGWRRQALGLMELAWWSSTVELARALEGGLAGRSKPGWRRQTWTVMLEGGGAGA